MSSKLEVLFACLVQQFRVSFGRNMFRFCVIVAPIVNGLILGMMYMNKPGNDFLLYVVFGSGILSFWSSICFSSASDINRERFMGTLESIFVAPGGFKTIILGKILGNTLWGIISMIISSSFVLLFFNKEFHVHSPLLLICALIIMTLSFIFIALLMSGLFTLSRNSRLIMNFLEYPIFLLCGVAFPLELLPAVVRPLSYLISPTLSVKALSIGVNGGTQNEILSVFGGLILLTIFYCVMSNYFFNKIIHKARVEATLGVY